MDKEKEENIERNKFLLNLLQENKKDQDEQNNTLDQKCSSMINILILIITIQCGIFVNIDLIDKLINTDLKYLLEILWIITLIGNFIALSLFTNAYNLKEFSGLTNEESIINYGETEEDIEKIYQEICVDYKRTIQENKLVIRDKIKYIKHGFEIIWVFTGIFIFTILLYLCILI